MTHPLSLLAAVVLLVAACGGVAPTPAGPTPPVVTPLPSERPIPTAAPTASPAPSPSSPAAPLEAIALEPVAEGLANPLFAGHAGDGSGRVFVIEQPGRVRVIRDGQLLPEPYLDIAGRISS
ncbi:MAG TPA: hypothetical protein VER83_10075, partial [Candidatus Nanopelagicales bacterium]|nr:hypothetical protein [Candidatus Nanopelagicales bacterium]